MRALDYTVRFRRDLKRELKGRFRGVILRELDLIVDLLRADAELPIRFQDHPLIGDLEDCRDLHVRPDLVLIYRKLDPNILELVRLGSHSKLRF